MPHFHPVDGYATAAAQYQAYLERTRLTHPSEDRVRLRKLAQDAAPGSIIDPEQEREDEPEGRESDSQEEARGDTNEGESFGNHYA